MRSPSADIFQKFFSSIQGAIILGSFVIAIAIMVSGGVIKVSNTSLKNTDSDSPSIETADAPSAPGVAAQPTEVIPTEMSVDDDPMIGSKDAPVTIVEFTDYECPFCKSFYTGAYVQIKKEYIDTGKAKLVVRDYPLSFHDPMATTEAIAANCAREQGGDSAYFKFHDAIFEKTTSNGTGLSKDDLYTMSSTLGLNAANFKTCLDSEKNKSEVTADITAGGSIGTPTFYIGKSTSDGLIKDVKQIVGAQPFATFKTTIDALLK